MLGILGNVVGNIDLQPDNVRYNISQSEERANWPTRTIRLSSTLAKGHFQLLDITDLQDMLTVEVDTSESGRRYQIKMTPKTNPGYVGRRAGRVMITTDDPEQPELHVSYVINFRE